MLGWRNQPHETRKKGTSMQPSAPTPTPTRPPQAPVRASLTSRLLQHLRPMHRDAAWQMIQDMRATMAQEDRRRRLMRILIALALVVAAFLIYLQLMVPAQ